jgi:histidine triad (HIT) family protein
MMDCIFCKIVEGDIPAEKVYEDDEIVAFSDIDPQAPVHVLVIPKRHIPNISEITTGDADLVGRLIAVGNRIAREKEIAGKGYRLVINSGPDGGQAVDHIHLHVLGGRKMTWPPG